jgi:hypothetical protein
MWMAEMPGSREKTNNQGGLLNMKGTYKFTKKQLLAKKEFVLGEIKKVWCETPDLTLCELIWKATENKPVLDLDDGEVVQMVKDYLPKYKEKNCLKNKLKKGLKACVTKMTLW